MLRGLFFFVLVLALVVDAKLSAKERLRQALARVIDKPMMALGSVVCKANMEDNKCPLSIGYAMGDSSHLTWLDAAQVYEAMGSTDGLAQVPHNLSDVALVWAAQVQDAETRATLLALATEKPCRAAAAAVATEKPPRTAAEFRHEVLTRWVTSSSLSLAEREALLDFVTGGKKAPVTCPTCPSAPSTPAPVTCPPCSRQESSAQFAAAKFDDDEESPAFWISIAFNVFAALGGTVATATLVSIVRRFSQRVAPAVKVPPAASMGVSVAPTTTAAERRAQFGGGARSREKKDQEWARFSPDREEVAFSFSS